MTPIDLDDPEAVAKADPSGMLEAALSLADQCRDGYRIGRSVQELPDALSLDAVVSCGMGGSGVAGDFLGALYRDRLAVPVEVVKDPTLPEFCGRGTLVLCSSYSGDTAETLSCFDAAAERGCRIVAIASGGELARRATEGGVPLVRIPAEAPAPRAAVGFLLLGAIGALESMGLVPAVAEDLDQATGALGELRNELDPVTSSRDNPAKVLAAWIEDRVPVVWGAEGLGSAAAVRWKTELNENAKVPAFAASLPELDHNEVVGWSKGAGDEFAVITLRHEGEDPHVAARFPVSLDIARESGARVHEVWARGQAPLAHLLSLVMLGGAASVYLGLLRGYDPAPIEAIARLKRVLAELEE